MTLATETIKLWRNNAGITAGETAEDDPEHIAAKAILALTAELPANREAQPVEVRRALFTKSATVRQMRAAIFSTALQPVKWIYWKLFSPPRQSQRQQCRRK